MNTPAIQKLLYRLKLRPSSLEEIRQELIKREQDAAQLLHKRYLGLSENQ